jgi:hypothetical protein
MEQAARMTVAKDRRKNRNKDRSQEKQAMRALILTAAVLAVLANAEVAQAGLSATPREAVASVDTGTPPETSRPERSRTERRAHRSRSRGIGGPIGAIGGAIGGIFRR